MIEEASNYYQVEDKFLVVLDSKIPSVVPDISSISSKSDVIFDLQIPIEMSLEDIQLKCALKSGVFPNSFYNINKTNSDYAIVLIASNGSPANNGNLALSIPLGNYNTESLRLKMQSLTNAAIVSAGYGDVSFVITYDDITCKYTFEIVTTGSTITEFLISFQSSDIITKTSVSLLADVVGLVADYKYISGDYNASLDTNAKFSLVSKKIVAPYISNLSGLKCFNVILKNYSTSSIPIITNKAYVGFGNSIIDSTYNVTGFKQNIKNNIICNVSCNCNPMEVIFYEKQSDFYIDIKEILFSRIHIQIVDNLGALVDFNNQDWSITLEFSLLKKKEFKTRNFYEILKGFKI